MATSRMHSTFVSRSGRILVNAETVATACIEVVTASNDPPDPVQVDRVAGWLEQAIKQKNDSTLLLVALG